MTAQETLAYRQAWKTYELSGHNVDKLSATDREALRADPVTRRTMDNRPAMVTARTKAAEAELPSAAELGNELADAFHKMVTNGDATALHDLDAKYATDALLIEVGLLRAVISELHRLHRKVKELEAKPSKTVEYKGVWSQETVYGVGNACTFGGSLWIAKTSSVSRRPGAGDGCWQLAVKSGSPGKCQCKCAAGEKAPQ